MAVDFKGILSRPVEEIKAPPPFPMGTYLSRIKGHEMVESGQKKTPGVRFTLNPFQAQADVDQEQLTEFGALDKEIRLTFWVSEDSAYRLKEFLVDHLGLVGNSLDEMIPQATNQTCQTYITQKLTEDGRTFSEVQKTAKAG